MFNAAQTWDREWDFVVRQPGGEAVLTVEVKLYPQADVQRASDFWRRSGPGVPGTTLVLVTRDTTFAWPAGTTRSEVPQGRCDTAVLLGKYLHNVDHLDGVVLELATDFWLHDVVGGVAAPDPLAALGIEASRLRGGRVERGV